MKRSVKILLKTAAITVLFGFGGLVAQAGGWDNFKLRYFSMTQVLNHTEKAVEDAQQSASPGHQPRVNPSELLNGGPPKDGIPSIDDPKFDSAATTPFDESQEVIGMVVNGEAKAYPIGILNWHEIVNDTIGGVNVSVTYCPLCDTAIAFERGDTTFGVSGRLYQSCLVMYDRRDDSLYAQPWGIGVLGAQVNQSLERVAAVKTQLGNWLERHPDSQILSTETGHERDYQRYPYGSYNRDRTLVFPVRNQDQLSLHPKDAISYIWQSDENTPQGQFSGESLQLVHEEIRQVGERTVQLGGQSLRVFWDEDLETVRVEDAQGHQVPAATAFAFVYPAFMESSGSAN